MMKVINYRSLKIINSDPLVNNVVEICRDLVCGCCTREENECCYAHHAPIVGEGDYVIFCTDHLCGKCECDSCRKFHAPEHLRYRVRDGFVGHVATLNSAHNNRGMDVAHAFPSSFYDQQVLKQMRTGNYVGDPKSR
jgi:hypothetical protein